MYTMTGSAPELTLRVHKWAVHLHEPTEAPWQPAFIWGEEAYGGYTSPDGWSPLTLEPHDVGLELDMLDAKNVDGDTTHVFYDIDMLEDFTTLLTQSFNLDYTVEPLPNDAIRHLDGITVANFAQADKLVAECMCGNEGCDP